MSRTVRYYYQLSDKLYSIGENDKTLIEETLKQNEKHLYNYFEMQTDYESNLESLLKYREDFNQWCDEIDGDCKFTYRTKYNHDSAVQFYFQSKSKNQLQALDMDNISYKEFQFFEKCINCGLMTFDDKYKGETIDAFGYDFSAFYPNMLQKILVPIKQGKRKKLKTIDYNNLEYGIYHVKLTTDDKRFKKVFMFSKDNHYTHHSINFAYKYKDEFDIQFELVQDGNYNALIYTEDKLVDGSSIFGSWFSSLNKLKQKFPKNKLVKRLMSSLWGSLTAFKRECFEDDDLNDVDVSELDDDQDTEYKLLDEKRYKDDSKEMGIRTLYYCIKTEQPYKHNLARLKPFLVSFCRSYVTKLIMKENLLDKLVRIHTDGIVLNQAYDFTHLKYYPKPEDKTTGKLKFENVMRYQKQQLIGCLHCYNLGIQCFNPNHDPKIYQRTTDD
jgi:hypothetical protein